MGSLWTVRTGNCVLYPMILCVFKMAENTKVEDDEKTSNVQMDEEEDSSEEETMEQDNDSDPEEATEKVVDPEVHKLELEVEANPYKYDSHLQLIGLLRNSGDLDKLRETRQNMIKIFPLTEELWLQWIKDEIPLACIPEHRKTIICLFEKGVKDYQSVKLWIEYCQFMMDNMEGDDGLASVRDVFERAITAAGLHVTEGSSIWDGYRDFEMAILDSFEQLLTDENKNTMESKIESQKEKVKSLFRRQVAVPLLGMQGTMRDFEDWMDDKEEDMPDVVVQAHEKALAKLEEIIPYEDTVASAEAPKLTEYRSYLEYETKKGDPVRIQCLYERAIKENCLVGDLWIEYTGYLDTKLKMHSVILPVYERALRNCPWVSILWQNYMKALERSKAEEATIKETLDKSLTCGFANAQDYLQLWHCYCCFLRRQVQEWSTDNEKVKALQEGFKSAINYMEHYFGKDGDSTSLIRRYWARIEAFKLDNIEDAQKLWEQVITGHARELEYWLEYANLARSCRSLPLCRKILQRAVQSASDNPEGATQALLSFEDEEGSLEDWDGSYARCHTRLTITNERRAKAAEKEAAREAEKATAEKAAVEKRKQAKAAKKEVKKIEKQNTKQQNLKRKAKDENANKESFTAEVSTEPVAKKPHIEPSNDVNENMKNEEEIEKPKYDRSTDSRKIFVSNLLFKVSEEQLKEKFSELGEVVDVRVVKNLAGRSKGFAYIEFKDESPVPAALALDRCNMEGRPMFISPCIDKTKNPTTFKFPTSLDKKTLFVSNLPFAIKETEVKELFEKFGEVKQVRLVSNKAGKPKGYGYVEFLDEQCASKAVVSMDGSVVSERTISVALSNPPTRKPNKPELPAPPPPGSRGRSKTQVALVPRSLQKKTTTTPTPTAPSTSPNDDKTAGNDKDVEVKKGFSNEYFSKLMQK